MFPTKLAMEIAQRVKLKKAYQDPEDFFPIMRDAIADVQMNAAAGSSVEECITIFKVWMMTAEQHRKGKTADEAVKLNEKQVQGLEIIHRMTLAQINGQIIGMLAKLAEHANDKERIEATKLLHAIMNGEDVEGSAEKAAGLIINCYSAEKAKK